ncbi:hypothetical protein [Candidatus Protochlamydia phocaeensis]|uniref:hypothetical protein n=1 Tax=Candidatus Protochlamydia phocaeensis TaxID=1414722 RepID=UPI0008396D15|nr:hypothetical protein [Candidatus Protochlamydia phocaeensis]
MTSSLIENQNKVQSYRVRMIQEKSGHASSLDPKDNVTVGALEDLNLEDFFNFDPTYSEEEIFDVLLAENEEHLPQEAIEWIKNAKAPHSTLNWLKIGHLQIYYQLRRALIIGPLQQFRGEEIIIGLAGFMSLFRRLSKLETEVETDLGLAKSDVVLLEDVKGAPLKSWQHANDRAKVNALRRLHYLQLKKRLEFPNPGLSKTVKILFNALKEQEEISLRLDWIEESLKVCENLYEVANSRIANFSYFYRTYKSELLIFSLLLVQAITIAIALW